MKNYHSKIEQVFKFIEDAKEQYNPTEIFVGFSGGTDSLLVADLISKRMDVKIFHANTGIGIEKTRQYVRDYCKKREWELVEIRAKEDCGQDYDEIVKERGFPGPPMHIKMYQRLKERCIEKLHRDYKQKRGRKIMMLTGIRHDESQIRAGYKNRIIDEFNGVVWVNPVYWFTKQDKHDYIQDNKLEVNPVHKILGMSGECLCGAYAHKGELDLVKLIEPETADRIEELEQVVMQKWPWGWEDQMPKYFRALREGQTDAFFDWAESDYFQPMCVGCGKTDSE